ncbi:MAG: imidazoleglycerol-phosphate dehydratase HisB [Armatimonadota bacterium]|nr:imidazoleglycerol-phosphate dehydratase HisB [Armatimonadota bacterium]MDR7520337.1 imidazoleglycerol-phosphate dehydratase HisB [Armatimonadota bacterium]MDR7550865.1 imidazoleglycerol-phosphate dehydratase HisB [Armatimonadota bacterium]
MSRSASVERTTSETQLSVTLVLDGEGRVESDTGVPFFDHLLAAFGRHGRLDLTVRAIGDLAVDAHHTVEDTGIVLGQAFRQALGGGEGIARYASIHLPMDEALVLVALDICGRPFLHYDVAFPADRIGAFPVDLVEEFLRAFCAHAGVTLHVALAWGRNSHHIAEAVFKGLGVVVGRAAATAGRGVPSTKGVL